jgi:hypothetical protein
MHRSGRSTRLVRPSCSSSERVTGKLIKLGNKTPNGCSGGRDYSSKVGTAEMIHGTKNGYPDTELQSKTEHNVPAVARFCHWRRHTGMNRRMSGSSHPTSDPFQHGPKIFQTRDFLRETCLRYSLGSGRDSTRPPSTCRRGAHRVPVGRAVGVCEGW